MVPWAVDGGMQPLHRLATVIASQQILTKWQSDLRRLAPAVDLSTLQQLDDRMACVNRILCEDFRSIVSESMLRLRTSTNINKDILQLKLVAFKCQQTALQHQRTYIIRKYDAAKIHDARTESLESILDLDFLDILDIPALSCTARTHLDPSSTSTCATSSTSIASQQLSLTKYRATSADIQQILQNAFARGHEPRGSATQYNRSDEEPQCAWSVPASHLAYWNRDKDTALQLWEQSSTRRIDLDLLGRTFAHIVADAGDCETMMRISDSVSDQSFIRDVTSDRFGRSLLMIAAASGNRHLFTTLLGHDADTRTAQFGPSLLDLAQAAGSLFIVKKIINDNIVLPSYTVATDNTIRAGQEDIAQCFHRWLDIENQDVIDTLAALAEGYGMPNLCHELRNITGHKATPSNAVNDLDQVEFPTLSPLDCSSNDILLSWQALEVYSDIR
ncbi:hypothetical protein LTR70_004073 [Exophiala xenobiotica]|uniref:Uncharacterized protein n=1 Tax=Lithohypha guttulata TaxID=1690604 RepID=A0ABR0KEI9_9EURO|nr:hypothetical protein LTR24_003483 [Lithohypha guttulata]KAK5321683.1 hypothetical protein LTR70_004073 [Exophiala xenobiotica]